MSRTKQAARRGKSPPGSLALTKARNEKKMQLAPQTTECDSNVDRDNNPAATSAIAPPKAQTTKSKRNRDEFEPEDKPAPAPPAKKKKYKSKTEREDAAAKPTVDKERGAGDSFDPAIAQMDPSLLADHFAKTVKRHYKKDTALELDEKHLPSSTFANMTSFTADRKKGVLGTFLESVVAGDRSKLTSAAKETARPHTVLLCQSGIRAADLARVLRAYECNGNAVVKLFAKHFKIEQQAVFLRKNKTGFGVGTPQRIQELIDTGALQLDNLARVVIDGSYLDEKQGGIWRMPDIFKAMLSILKMETVQERIETGELQVVVF